MSEEEDSGEIPLEPMTIIESAVVVAETEPPVSIPSDGNIAEDHDSIPIESEKQEGEEAIEQSRLDDESE